MKRFYIFAGLIVAITQLAGAPPLLAQAAPVPATTPTAPNPNAPRIRFSETAVDFGKVQTTDTLKHTFTVTNTGKAVLEITSVQPGCGCTTAGTWDRQIQPGQTGKIPIQFNPANFSGPTSKGVTVVCNDPAQGTHYLQIRATVSRLIDVQPQYVHFLPVEGETTNETKVVRIVSSMDEALTLETPRSSNPLFKTELKTVRLGKEFELHVTYAGPVSNASPQGVITIPTSAAALRTLTVTAYAMPQPALVAMPPHIQLPAGPFTAEYRYPATIRSNGRLPVKLSDPSVNAEGVTVQVQEMEPGRLFRLQLAFPANFRAQPGQPLQLTVKTTHPKHPVLKVPITQSAAITAPVFGPIRPATTPRGAGPIRPAVTAPVAGPIRPAAGAK